MAGRKLTHSEHWWGRNLDPTKVRCKHPLKLGGQCKSEALLHGDFCARHAGEVEARQVESMARRAEMLPKADQAVEQILDDPEASHKDKLNAAALVYRANGVDDPKVQINLTKVDKVEQLFTSILSDPDKMLAPSRATGVVSGPKELDAAQAAYDAEHEPPTWEELVGGSDVVDAEVVEDDDEDLIGFPVHRAGERHVPWDGLADRRSPAYRAAMRARANKATPSWLREDLERIDPDKQNGWWG